MNLHDITKKFSWAFETLREYARDAAQDCVNLAPIFDAKSLSDLVYAREHLEPYLACNANIDELHAELCALADAESAVDGPNCIQADEILGERHYSA